MSVLRSPTLRLFSRFSFPVSAAGNGVGRRKATDGAGGVNQHDLPASTPFVGLGAQATNQTKKEKTRKKGKKKKGGGERGPRDCTDVVGAERGGTGPRHGRSPHRRLPLNRFDYIPPYPDHLASGAQKDDVAKNHYHPPTYQVDKDIIRINLLSCLLPFPLRRYVLAHTTCAFGLEDLCGQIYQSPSK